MCGGFSLMEIKKLNIGKRLIRNGMLRNKLYKCEIPSCGRKVHIRSTIKGEKYKGYKVCNPCKSKYDGSSLKKFSLDKKIERRIERDCLYTFFKTAVEELKRRPYCENCGVKINTNYAVFNNIAHILPKRKYKSVMCNMNNFLILCDSKDNKDGNSCHKNFDSGISKAQDMPAFNLAKERFKLFKEEVKEIGDNFLNLE